MQASVSEDHLLADGDGIDATAGIELMAQAVAASITHRHPERARYIGFLLGVKNYRCNEQTLLFGRYDIEVRDELLMFDDGLGTFQVKLLLNSVVLASGQIKAFLANSQDQQQEVLDGKI